MQDRTANFELCFILKSRLKTLLQSRGITAAELSRRSGVPKQVISIWLTGVEPRKLTHLKRVADSLGVTIDDLCFKPTQLPSPTHEWVEGVFEGRVLRRVERTE
jgi:transcriptional regulator with XRE-family HTH domain